MLKSRKKNLSNQINFFLHRNINNTTRNIMRNVGNTNNKKFKGYININLYIF